MMSQVLIYFVDLFVTVFDILLIARVIGSYFMAPENNFYAGLVSVTEPVLAPVRRIVPPVSGIDLAPLVAFFLLEILQRVVHGLVR